MPAGECCGSQNQLFTTEDQTKKITLTFLIKGEALIRGEGGKFVKINKRGGSNKRGGWKFC